MQKLTRSLSILSIFGILAVTGCVTHEEHRGYAIEFADLEKVRAGVSRKQDVVEALGSPSTTSDFDQEKWYYINTKLETTALTKPKVVGGETITVTFNDNGIVQSVQQGKGEGRRNIKVAKDKTRTEGRSMTMMQQLLGNLGRFNASKQGAAGNVRTPQPGL